MKVKTMGEGTYKDVLDVPDDYVPSDNNDLVKKYDKFVALLVRKYNTVNPNFNDLLQHVWMKLVEVNIIEKYQKSGGSLPKTLTGLQAAAYLQMKWGQFKVSIWRHVLGDYRQLGGVKLDAETTNHILERDKGICCRCQKDCLFLQKTFAMYNEETRKQKRQTLLERYGIPTGREEFWVISRIKGAPERSTAPEHLQTVCLFCCTRSKSNWAPLPVQGTWGSRKALYTREDIERFRIVREETKRCKKQPDIDPIIFTTKSLFKLYLARSVHNIYANWCRTRFRRYKEVYGTNEEGQSWDYNLMDNSCSPDDLVSLYHAVKLAASGEEDIRDVDLGSHDNEAKETQLLNLIADGYSLTEVVQKMSLPKTVLRTISA